MATLSRAALKEDQAAKWPNNDTNAITPQRLRQPVIDVVDSAPNIVDDGRTIIVENVADMLEYDWSSVSDNASVQRLGYYSAGDGGGCFCRVVKSATSAHNGVTVFVANDGTRLIFVDDGFYSLKRCGAVGDGFTADDTAIDRAFTVWAGKTIFIPKGNYRFTSQHLFPLRTTIQGDGSESTVLYYRPSTTSANFFLTASDIDGVRLKNLTIYNDHGSGGQACGAIACDGTLGPVSDVVLDDVNIDSFDRVGLYLKDTNYITITRSRFIRISGKASNGGNGTTLGVAIKPEGGVNGLYISTGTRFSWNDIVVSDGTQAMYAWTIRDCFIERNGNAASPASSDILYLSNVNAFTFEGNYCEGNLTGTGTTDSLVKIHGCHGVAIKSNLLFSDYGGTNWSKWLIGVTGGTRGISVENNYFANPITGFVYCDGDGSSVKLHRNSFLVSGSELETYDSVMNLCTAAYMDFDRPFVTTFSPGSLANMAANAINVTVSGARIDRNDSAFTTVVGGGADIVVSTTILNNTLVRVTVLNVKGTTYDPGTLTLAIRVMKQGL